MAAKNTDLAVEAETKTNTRATPAMVPPASDVDLAHASTESATGLDMPVPAPTGDPRAGTAEATTDDGAEPANIPAANEFDPAGAPIQIVPDVDPSHPAVDNDPRAGTSVAQNRIDFNDPTLSMEDAVEKNLAKQGDTPTGKAG